MIVSIDVLCANGVYYSKINWSRTLDTQLHQFGCQCFELR